MSLPNAITPLTPAQLAHQESQTDKEGFIHRNLVAVDMLGNTLTGGANDETISSRSARAAERGSKFGKLMCSVLNLFNSNHGPKAQAGDLERAQVIEQLEKSTLPIK